MKAYSIDLRTRIVNTYKAGEISQRALAARFCVAKSFVQKLLKQEQQTGCLEPKGHGGGQTPKLNSAQHQVLVELVQAQNDATLPELVEQLAEKTGVRVSCSTLSRTLSRLRLTRKKKR